MLKCMDRLTFDETGILVSLPQSHAYTHACNTIHQHTLTTYPTILTSTDECVQLTRTESYAYAHIGLRPYSQNNLGKCLVCTNWRLVC